MATDKPAIFVVVHKIGTGGLTQAVLDQVRMFSRVGHRTTIVTLDPGTEQAPRVGGLRAAGRLAEGVEVRNIHDELRARWSAARPGAVLPVPTLDDDPSLLRDDGRDDESPFTRYYDGTGTYVAFRRRWEDLRPDQLDFFAQRRVVARELVGVDGRVYSTLDMVDGRTSSEHLLAADGESYLERSADPRTRKGRGVVVRTPAEGAVHSTTYRGLPEWHVAWLQEIVDAEPVPPVVLAESPSTIPKAARLRPGSAVRLGMLHNNQFGEAPYRPGSKVRKDHAGAFAALGDLDALVVLSEPQRRDLIDLFGHADRVRVVPNATVLPDLDRTPKDPRLVSMVTRLDPLKGLDEAIRAFALVAGRVQDARLEIYGSGPDEGRLAGLIEELGLAGTVTLMGRTSEPHAVMARSTATVMTSSREAMPLSILESQASGTAVVSYDFVYGPATLIEEGSTGYVVPWGDRAALADAVVRLLDDPDLARATGERSRAAIEEGHSYDVVLGRWEELFGDLGVRVR